MTESPLPGYVLVRRHDLMHAVDALHRRARDTEKGLTPDSAQVLIDNVGMWNEMVGRLYAAVRGEQVAINDVTDAVFKQMYRAIDKAARSGAFS